MATRQEYRARLLSTFDRDFGLRLQSIAPDRAFSIEAFADRLGGILEEIERQHLGAASHIQNIRARNLPEPWQGHGELAFLLYYLHHPPPELRARIDALPVLRVVWEAMATVAAPSPFSPDDLRTMIATFPTGPMVRCGKWGDVYGAGKYEVFDGGWASTLMNCAINLLPDCPAIGFGVAKFVVRDWMRPLALQPGPDGDVRIAVIGDWGSGAYSLNGLPHANGPAYAVMDTLLGLTQPPDYLIHLGDTYYSGTDATRWPVQEETLHLTDVLEQYPGLARRGKCFTLNSNHEMYGGGYGYFGAALSHPLFSGQRGCSYFALEFGDWIVAGIDSAYFDTSIMYMDGGLGAEDKDPQYVFLRQLAKKGKRVVLLSHHPGIRTDGTKPCDPLWSQVTGIVMPDCWYWGHTHLYAAYSGNAHSRSMKTSCIGHGSMPFADPPGMDDSRRNVDWYSRTPLDPYPAPPALYDSRPRARNGFVVLTLGKSRLTEQVYDIGNTTPIWSRQCFP